MTTQTDMTTPTVVEGWLRDLGLTPIRRPDGTNNWNIEFTVAGSTTLVMNVVNPKSIPRAIMVVCGMSPVPGHVTSFLTLDEGQRLSFWKDLRTLLSREFVEYQLEGTAVVECPRTLRVTAVRFDDGLTLDSFARSVSSVCKACSDAVVHFTERLGDPNLPASGEFAFKKTLAQ
ncbi:MAG TPA: DUF2299 family protein [Steroidobacteraceae bacterium]|nr:DUF2299 family protein [Steroidobacteraceae bacterium]